MIPELDTIRQRSILQAAAKRENLLEAFYRHARGETWAIMAEEYGYKRGGSLSLAARWHGRAAAIRIYLHDQNFR